jgi:NAD(P)-dependent dehydrogenase (short-subunit alcohol dehydrogenase family)
MKRILVTGASSGIGFSLVNYLLESDYFVYAVSRNIGRLSPILEKYNDKIIFISMDVTNILSYDEALSEIGELSGVVHCAGIVINNPIKYFNIEKYNSVIEVNQTAPLALTSILLKKKKLAKNCSIIFISSINGPRVAIKGCAAYAASKCALIGITRVLALELSSSGIRVNAVLPGMVETELVDGLSQLSNNAIAADKARYPLGNRYAKPSEISSLIEFLISPKSEFVTGQEFVVDGGYCVN